MIPSTPACASIFVRCAAVRGVVPFTALRRVPNGTPSAPASSGESGASMRGFGAPGPPALGAAGARAAPEGPPARPGPLPGHVQVRLPVPRHGGGPTGFGQGPGDVLAREGRLALRRADSERFRLAGEVAGIVPDDRDGGAPAGG